MTIIPLVKKQRPTNTPIFVEENEVNENRPEPFTASTPSAWLWSARSARATLETALRDHVAAGRLQGLACKVATCNWHPTKQLEHAAPSGSTGVARGPTQQRHVSGIRF